VQISYKTKAIKANLHTTQMGSKCVAMQTKTCAPHFKPDTAQRHWQGEIAATFVFICTGHWNF